MGNILLVEDNEALSYSLARQFEKAGYHVIVVRSSMAALTVLDSPCGIDLVLADIVMPEGQPNGISLCRMARMKRQGIKVALMTGYDIEINSHTLPGKLYRKPVDVDCLMTEVGTLLSA